MSRTYRRKNVPWCDKQWLFCNHYGWGTWATTRQEFVPTIERHREILAKYHADGYRGHKEPGPSWFRNLTVQRPARRGGREELRKFLLDPEYDPNIVAMPYLEYWT